MGSDMASVLATPTEHSFNSRSRMGSDDGEFARHYRRRVSIRAPAWGATLGDGVIGVLREFQFALPHGERPKSTGGRNCALQFQFALPHGERRPHDLLVFDEAAFQFALPHGERLLSIHVFMRVSSFNSRSRMGSDPSMPTLQRLTGSFNSRSRMGSDTGMRLSAGQPTVSIRAPAWGATQLPLCPHRRADVSIRAPAWGATISGLHRHFWIDVSIRAPAWGATA